jgi:hypothetical protein
MSFDATAVVTGNYDELFIYKNGTTIFGRQRSAISDSQIMYLTTSAQLRLITSDTIEIYVSHNSGTNLHIGSLTGQVARLEISKLF